MMTLENRLQIAIGLMAFTGALLLGIAQSNYLLPALMGFAVILSHVVTDRLGWLRLHRSLANLAMVLTAALSLTSRARNSAPTSAALLLPDVASTSLIMTLAPAMRSAVAMARPIPAPPPVTCATLPVRSVH